MGCVLHYSACVSTTIPPSASLPVAAVIPTSGDSGAAGSHSAQFAASAAAAAQPSAAATPTSATVQTAQLASIVAAAQTALAQTVNLSPQAQQAVKMEAFNQLVTNLVQQVQPAAVALPSNWPAGGVTPALQQMVTALLQQVTAGQPLPQQLVSLQSWPSVLAQSVLQHAGQSGALAATASAQASTATGARPDTSLPALQTWLVQQGTVQTSDGDRGFTLTLRVPVAWAQAQAALGSALPAGAGPAGTGLGMGLGSAMTGLNSPIPFSGSAAQLANGSMGLVMQPLAAPGTPAALAAQAMRTSAILQLEFQPLAAAAQTAQAASVYMPAHMLPQDIQAMLQGRGTDPWLLMAQAQADGQGQKNARNANEQAQFCNRAGCQYQGRAICAQPFCAEMNYLWSIDRAQRR